MVDTRALRRTLAPPGPTPRRPLLRRLYVQVYWLRLDLTDGVGSFSRCGCRPWSSGHEFLLC